MRYAQRLRRGAVGVLLSLSALALTPAPGFAQFGGIGGMGNTGGVGGNKPGTKGSVAERAESRRKPFRDQEFDDCGAENWS